MSNLCLLHIFCKYHAVKVPFPEFSEAVVMDISPSLFLLTAEATSLSRDNYFTLID